MNWVHDTLADFGKQLGIADLTFGTHGVAQLELQSGGLIAVEPVSRGMVNEVLVYIIQPLGFDAAMLMRRALARAHFAHADALPVQVAVRGEDSAAQLIMLVRLPERSFTLQTLGHAIDFLSRWFEQVKSS
jgi:type III secretion system chaperone SycN